MARPFKRPRHQTELEDLEAAGFWKAIALANKIGEDASKITLDTILAIHREIFQLAIPEIAGRFRKAGEDIVKLKSPTRELRQKAQSQSQPPSPRLPPKTPGLPVLGSCQKPRA